MSSQNQSKEAQNGGREGGEGGGCGRNCLSSCCLLQGAKLPVYCFSEVTNDSVRSSEKNEPQLSFLERLLKEWDDRKVRGLFHHDIIACESKILEGEHGFIIHLIEGRDLKKRPTEFDADKVLQPFDDRKFNFTKISQEEVLFRFEESEKDKAQYHLSIPLIASDSPSVIAINVLIHVLPKISSFYLDPTNYMNSFLSAGKPNQLISYGHVLLIPRILEKLPQRIDQRNFLLAVCMTKEAGNPYFRMGYNSLGAFATINHLHFQGYFLKETFPVEKAVFQIIATLANGVEIFQLSGYPVRGLVFKGGRNIHDLSDTVSSACIFLQNNNSPYNVLISDCGRHIFILLQCYAERRALGEVRQEFLDNQVNPAVWELSGHIAMKRRKDFEKASEEKVLRFLAVTSVSEKQFQKIKEHILAVVSHRAVECEGNKVGEKYEF